MKLSFQFNIFLKHPYSNKGTHLITSKTAGKILYGSNFTVIAVCDKKTYKFYQDCPGPWKTLDQKNL